MDQRKAPLLLIRGLPGSGKSTLAKELLHSGLYDIHLEADMYHVRMGRYTFNRDVVNTAHCWCLETTRVMLNIGRRVVVSNTFVTLDEIAPYMYLGFDVSIEKATGDWKSVHDVPEETMDHMRKRWQELP